jgi:alcohol dehydrogenase class IV
MNPFTFQVPSNVLFEGDASGKVADLAAEFGSRRILLVTDKGVRGAGLTAAAEDALRAASLDVLVFEDVVADPPSEVIEQAVSLCRDERIDLVLSIGGGSALDTAKLVAYLARSNDRLEDIYGVGLARGERLPLLLVPTTAGTGSEVTPIAIVTTPTTERRVSFHPDCCLIGPFSIPR